MPRTTRRRESTSVRQEQIIDAAQKLILKNGSEHVTIRRIAKEVGISEGAIYRHFKSKSDIFCLLLDNVGENLLGDIESSIITEGSVTESLHNILLTQLATINKRHGMSFQVIAEVISLGDRKLNRQLAEIMSKYLVRIKNLLIKGVEIGEFRGDIDPEAAAMLYFGMVESVSNYWTLNNYKFVLEEKMKPMWDIFQMAIAKLVDKAVIVTESEIRS
jgi:TetR/AcrR family fatty acid metabolism transcriptional regulator